MALCCQSAEPLPDAQAGSPGGPGACGPSPGQHRHGDGETNQYLEKLELFRGCLRLRLLFWFGRKGTIESVRMSDSWRKIQTPLKVQTKRSSSFSHLFQSHDICNLRLSFLIFVSESLRLAVTMETGPGQPTSPGPLQSSPTPLSEAGQ